MYYVRYPLSFRQVKDILHERGTLRCDRLCLTTPPSASPDCKLAHNWALSDKLDGQAANP